MTGLEMQANLKGKLNDKASAWQDAQYLNAINEGIKYCVNARYAKKDPNFLTVIDITNGQEAPADFIEFAGTVPVDRRDVAGIHRWYHASSSPLTAKYYRMRSLLASLSDSIDLSYSHVMACESYAVYRLEQMRGTLTKQAEQAKADCDGILAL